MRDVLAMPKFFFFFALPSLSHHPLQKTFLFYQWEGTGTHYIGPLCLIFQKLSGLGDAMHTKEEGGNLWED